MRKTLEELNNEYVPDNKSTNFSNSTCRKRLLNRFIGEGRWQYIYDGRRVVAVEILDDDSVNMVEEEVDSKPVSVKEIFKEINFRRYRWNQYIYDNYNEIQKIYQSHKHLRGIEVEYNRVMKKLLTQAYRYISNHYQHNRFLNPNIFYAFDRSNWDVWYKNIYEDNLESTKYYFDWKKPRTCKYYRNSFKVDVNGIDYYINEVDKIVAMFSGFSGDRYDYMVDLLNQFKEIKSKAIECNAQSEKVYESFCKGYISYTSRRQRSTWNDFDWDSFRQTTSRPTETKYFTGCVTQRELKKRYRELAKKLHPDHGGNQDEFIAMKNEYDRLMKHAA